MKKIVIGIILLLGLFFIRDDVSASTGTGLVVGSHVHENLEDDRALKNGWEYVSETRTLILNCYRGESIIFYATEEIDTLNIELVSKNYITSTYEGITTVNGKINLAGSGSLEIKLTGNDSIGINANNISINGGKYIINSNWALMVAKTDSIYLNDVIVIGKNAKIGFQAKNNTEIYGSKLNLDVGVTGIHCSDATLLLNGTILVLKSASLGFNTSFLELQEGNRIQIRSEGFALFTRDFADTVDAVYGSMTETDFVPIMEFVPSAHEYKNVLVNATYNEEIFYPYVPENINLDIDINNFKLIITWENRYHDIQKYHILYNGVPYQVNGDELSYEIELGTVEDIYTIEMWAVDSDELESAHMRVSTEKPNNPSTSDNIILTTTILVTCILVLAVSSFIIINRKK